MRDSSDSRRSAVSHLYNLRGSRVYQSRSLTYTKTPTTRVDIGIRKKPCPEGQPGFLRVDSVHQGGMDKHKGVYHVNLVDEVTQDEIVVTVEGISEEFLRPALETALKDFPFVILGFHSDNGSEYINKVVARLLQKLLIEQTKSRSRRTNDNALVEGKNAAVVRKHFGYAHIPRKYATLMNKFNRDHLNPYLFFHRQCAFATETIDERQDQESVQRLPDALREALVDRTRRAVPQARHHERVASLTDVEANTPRRGAGDAGSKTIIIQRNSPPHATMISVPFCH